MNSHLHIAAARTRRKAVALALALASAAVLWCVPAHAQSHSFVWRATKGQGVVYLVGSIHVLTRDYHPLAPALDTAYRDSALLVEEVDMGEMLGPDAQMQLLARGMLPS